jgi:hypothetical protein
MQVLIIEGLHTPAKAGIFGHFDDFIVQPPNTAALCAQAGAREPPGDAKSDGYNTRDQGWQVLNHGPTPARQAQPSLRLTASRFDAVTIVDKNSGILLFCVVLLFLFRAQKCLRLKPVRAAFSSISKEYRKPLRRLPAIHHNPGCERAGLVSSSAPLNAVLATN